MKSTKKIFVCLGMLIASLTSLQAKVQLASGSSHTQKRSIRSIEEDAFNVVAYLPLFLSAEEKYLQENNTEPKIKCKNCTTKQLSMCEFGGGLIGMSLKDVVDGKDNFGQSKLILDGFLKVVSEGVYLDIVNYMLRIANETKQVCSHCSCDSNMWICCM